MTSQDMMSSATLGTTAAPRVEASVRQWLTEDARIEEEKSVRLQTRRQNQKKEIREKICDQG